MRDDKTHPFLFPDPMACEWVSRTSQCGVPHRPFLPVGNRMLDALDARSQAIGTLPIRPKAVGHVRYGHAYDTTITKLKHQDNSERSAADRDTNT